MLKINIYQKSTFVLTSQTTKYEYDNALITAFYRRNNISTTG
jgi:hypothetical protein